MGNLSMMPPTGSSWGTAMPSTPADGTTDDYPASGATAHRKPSNMGAGLHLMEA